MTQFDFKTFDEYDPGESITMLIYGPAGSGKTDFAGSYGERTLYVDVGKSRDTFFGPSFVQRRGNFRGIYVPIYESGTGKNSLVPHQATGFDNVCDAIDQALEKIPEKFDLIVIDECTRLRALAMNKGLEVNAATERSKTKATALNHDVIIPAVQDFGTEMSIVEQFMNVYTDIAKRVNKHFLVVAHERHVYQKVPGIGNLPSLVRTLPGFTGQTFPDAVSNIFDIVWHFSIANGNIFRARTLSPDNEVTKTRYGGIFAEFETNPSLPDVIRRIKEQIPLKAKGKP